MRKRYQQGSLTKVGGSWIAQWWEDGHRRKRTLGRIHHMTKAQAKTQLASIVAPINRASGKPLDQTTLVDFVGQIYFPFYRRKWKGSTRGTNESRIHHYLISEFSEWRLDSFSRDGLQDFLDRKSAAGLSFSTVNHLRWDLKQIFGMAAAEG